jgi:hypothetical protein
LLKKKKKTKRAKKQNIILPLRYGLNLSKTNWGSGVCVQVHVVVTLGHVTTEHSCLGQRGHSGQDNDAI